jgi:C1A family cysteine protease
MVIDQTVYRVVPSSPDSRDWIYRYRNASIRTRVMLTEYDSLVEDQGELGSCAAGAITSAYELRVQQEYPSDFRDLSRLFLYYNTRFLENTVSQDLGVFQLRNAFRSIDIWGICSEDIWPYDISKFDLKPSDESYADALRRRLRSYTRVPTVRSMLENINDERPLVLGMEIFSGFLTLTADNSRVSQPGDFEPSLGGHAVCILGYDLETLEFLAKNSYGTDWGSAGYCWIPFEYVSRFGFECWAFEIAPETPEPTDTVQ